jgi:hypothetical protein
MKKDGTAARGSSASSLRKLVFWEFPRASWQYDIVVALILLFIFATPRDWFSDQPRAASVTLISSNHGQDQLFLEPEILNDIPEKDRIERATELIRRKTGKRTKVVRIEAIRDEAEQEIKGFIAYTSPQK